MAEIKPDRFTFNEVEKAQARIPEIMKSYGPFAQKLNEPFYRFMGEAIDLDLVREEIESLPVGTRLFRFGVSLNIDRYQQDGSLEVVVGQTGVYQRWDGGPI